MSWTGEGSTGTGTFARGIHPPDQKALAAEAAIEVLPTPKVVAMSLLQHTGAPSMPIVKPRQEVNLGEPIGEPQGMVSAFVHASIAGTAQKASVATLPNGRHVSTIPIKAGDQQLAGQALRDDLFGGDWPLEKAGAHSPEQIAEAVRSAGIVGLGGAAFPTHVKFQRNPDRPIDTLLVNGCECEPYLTADYRLMIETPRPILAGAILAAHAVGAERIKVAIEDNKPDAIASMCQEAAGSGVDIQVIKTKYPAGGERQLIPAALGRTVPAKGLPLDVGVVVLNVATAAAVARAVLRGKPLTHRVITVSGAGIQQPKNLLVPIGTSYGELIDYCGGLKPEAARVVAGGPMMGFTLGNLKVPVTKGTSGITVLTERDVRRAQMTVCVRCGRCVDVCPLNLVPTRLALASKARNWDLAKRYHLFTCMECGCCAYSCPASIPLVQLIRMGKATAPRN